VLSTKATAVLFTPIAVDLARVMGLPVEPFAVAVIFASNCSFASPVGYQTSKVAEKIATGGYWDGWLYIFALNPMVGVIDGIRWAVFGEPALSLGAFGISCLAVAFVLVTGWMFFHRTEHSFADVL